MFFASLSDVYKEGLSAKGDDLNSTKNEEAIAGILSSYALPVVSFRQKAERGSHIFISAYASFGFEVDYYDDDENAHLTDSVRQRSSSLLYVPVGVEIGRGINKSLCEENLQSHHGYGIQGFTIFVLLQHILQIA